MEYWVIYTLVAAAIVVIKVGFWVTVCCICASRQRARRATMVQYPVQSTTTVYGQPRGFMMTPPSYDQATGGAAYPDGAPNYGQSYADGYPTKMDATTNQYNDGYGYPKQMPA